MTKNPAPIAPNEVLNGAGGPPTDFEKSGELFKCLCDDQLRAEFYRSRAAETEPLKFQSRADTKRLATDPSHFRQDAYLVTDRAQIEEALTQPAKFSNSPYQALGSGTFMLGLDGVPHQVQRTFASPEGLKLDAKTLYALADVAFKAASTLPLKSAEFDLVELAEQAALRFVGLWFGFSADDHWLLQESLRAAYKALNFQILARHFVTDPTLVRGAAELSAKLLARVGELLDDPEAPELIKDDRELRALLEDESFKPLLRTLPGWTGELSGTERAVVAVGLLAGIVGNVQASVSIAINEFFRSNVIADATKVAKDNDAKVLTRYVMEALRLNPPAAFLPRRTTELWNGIPENSEVVLAMGAAMRDASKHNKPEAFDPTREPDPLIFGGQPGETHRCIGKHIAMPLIVHFVARVLQLPGLEQVLDAETGAAKGLKKLWGFKCETYPMRFARQDVLLHQPLNVVMKIRTPTYEHAELLKKIIKYGAPRIEFRLRQARHVHFSWFLFLENDTKLALFTTYDGDFDAYLEHFAEHIGPLFDKLFEHIEDAPPRPVEKHPKEFVDTIRRYNARPAEGYFFSAYPLESVAQIASRAAVAAAASKGAA